MLIKVDNPKVPLEYKWLNLREKYDNQARNKDLEDFVINKLSKLNKIKILDLGAGGGSNFFYFNDKFKQKQTWTLVDKNPNLQQYIHRDIIKRNGDFENLSILTSDFLSSTCPIYNQEYKLVLANAVFDLLTQDQFDQLMKNFYKFNLIDPSTIFYFTLNINDKIFFNPREEEDQRVVEIFQQHMSVTEKTQKRMGVECTDHIEKTFEKYGLKNLKGESIWKIDPNDTEFLKYKMKFIENACRSEKLNSTSIHNWFEKRNEQIEEKKLSIHVCHYDLVSYSDLNL